MNLLRVALLGLAIGMPVSGFAQWQWLDKDGRKVFSDQPPPLDTPARNILKQPGPKGKSVASEAATAAAASDAAASAPARPVASAPRVSGKDKELEDKKKLAEGAEAEKKRVAEEKFAKEKAETCERARRSKASFDSGVRISRMNAKGEQEFLDEAARATETKRLQAILDKDCK